MHHDIAAALDALRTRHDRRAALALGIGLLLLSWGSVFTLDSDGCIAAAALCTLFCMHVSNAAQAWRNASEAARLGMYRAAQVLVELEPREDHFQCHATVWVEGLGTWRYANVGPALPSGTPEPGRVYFKPGTPWPVLVVTEHAVLIAGQRPTPCDTPAHPFDPLPAPLT
jgi:hypothetical protein